MSSTSYAAISYAVNANATANAIIAQYFAIAIACRQHRPQRANVAQTMMFRWCCDFFQFSLSSLQKLELRLETETCQACRRAIVAQSF